MLIKQIAKLTPFKDFAIHSLICTTITPYNNAFYETANLQYCKYPTFACLSDYKKKQIFSATVNTAAYSSKKEERKNKSKAER